MIRSSTRLNSSESSSGLLSPQASIRDPDIPSLDDNSTNNTILLPSSITVKTRHENEYQLVTKAMMSKTNDTPQRLLFTSDRSSHLTELAADMIESNLLPLSLVENPQLQSIFQKAEPSYDLPKRKYFIGNILHQMYDQTRTKVQSQLHSALGECWYWSSYFSHPEGE